MVGIYKILKRRLPSTATVPEHEAEIILKADGTAVFFKVPWFDEFGQRFVCDLSGSAKWELDDKINNGWGWSVAFEDYRPETIPTERRCDLRNTIIGGFLILSRSAPYRTTRLWATRTATLALSFKELARKLRRCYKRFIQHATEHGTATMS